MGIYSRSPCSRNSLGILHSSYRTALANVSAGRLREFANPREMATRPRRFKRHRVPFRKPESARRSETRATRACSGEDWATPHSITRREVAEQINRLSTRWLFRCISHGGKLQLPPDQRTFVVAIVICWEDAAEIVLSNVRNHAKLVENGIRWTSRDDQLRSREGGVIVRENVKSEGNEE